MKTVIVKRGQTLFDVAIRHCGNINAVYPLSQLNNIPLHHTFVVNQELNVPALYKEKIVQYFSLNKINPCSGVL
jgi:LysM repeat protein